MAQVLICCSTLSPLTIIILALLDLMDALLPYLGVPITGRTAMVLGPFPNAAQDEEEEKNKTRHTVIVQPLLRLLNAR